MTPCQYELDTSRSAASAGLRYVEGALPDTAGVASLLDQLALVQFLLDKLPEAEASARRMSDIAASLFGKDDAAKAMCDLRLGAVLAGMAQLLLQLISLAFKKGPCTMHEVAGP